MPYPLHTFSMSMRVFVIAGHTSLLGACADDAPEGQDTGSGAATQATSVDSTGDTAPTGSSTTDAPPTGTSVQPTSTGTTSVDTTGTGTTDDTTGDTTTGDTTTTTYPGTTAGSTTDPVDTWQPPACASVTGTGAVTFSTDQGATLAPMDQQIVPVTYTFGLVALGEPGAMLAGSGGEIFASSDAGCSWHSIGATPSPNAPALILRAAGATRAYGFGDNDPTIVRVDDEILTKIGSPAGPHGIVGLGVAPSDPDHVRVGDAIGRLWGSTDAGTSWNPLGVPAFADSIAYRVAFDPQDLDHVVVGALVEGVLVSHDAGATWTGATGLGPGAANGFNLVVSPAQGEIVWVEALDLADPNDATSRHIYRSEDGGLTFTAVIDADEATLYNGNHLFAHPTDPDILYFVFGSNFNNYGTDLFRYDHGADAITMTHNMWHDTVIEFLPGDPSLIYLGLSIEPG